MYTEAKARKKLTIWHCSTSRGRWRAAWSNFLLQDGWSTGVPERYIPARWLCLSVTRIRTDSYNRTPSPPSKWAAVKMFACQFLICIHRKAGIWWDQTNIMSLSCTHNSGMKHKAYSDAICMPGAIHILLKTCFLMWVHGLAKTKKYCGKPEREGAG